MQHYVACPSKVSSNVSWRGGLVMHAPFIKRIHPGRNRRAESRGIDALELGVTRQTDASRRVARAADAGGARADHRCIHADQADVHCSADAIFENLAEISAAGRGGEKLV